MFARGTAEFMLVEDDGISLDYQRGGYTTIRLTGDEIGNCKAERVHAGFELPYTEIKFVLPDTAVYIPVT